MSRDFYRRDFENSTRPRREEERDVSSDRSHATTKSRSNSRPPTARRSTMEGANFYPLPRKLSMQADSGSDPRLRNDTTTPNSTKASTPTTTPLLPSSTGFEPGHTIAMPNKRGDLGEDAHNPHVDKIASLLVDYSKEALSAGYAEQREDALQKQVLQAEKEDEQNRRIFAKHGGYATATAQSEMKLKEARRQLDDARARRKEAEQRRLAIANVTAAGILEITQRRDTAEADRAGRDQNAKQFKVLEAKISAVMQELADTKTEFQKAQLPKKTEEVTQLRDEIQETKGLLAIAKQEFDEAKKELQQMKISTQIVAKKLETLTDSQGRDLKKMQSETVEMSKAHKHSMLDVDKWRNESNVAVETLRALIEATSKNAETSSEVHGRALKAMQDESARVVKRHLEHGSETTRLRTEFHKVLEETKARNAAIEKLSAIVGSLSQHPDFARLQASVQTLSQPHTLAQGKIEKQLESDLAALKQDTLQTKNAINSLRAEKISRDKSIGGRLQSIEKRIDANTSFEAVPAHGSGTESALRKEFNLLRQEFRTTHAEVAKLSATMRATSEESTANSHSIRALTQRYNNLSSEGMVQAMLRQLENLYPHAADAQARLDALARDLQGFRVEFEQSEKAREERLITSFNKVSHDIEVAKVDATNDSADAREQWKKIVDSFKTERDGLKAEMARDMKTLEDCFVARLAELQERLEKSSQSGLIQTNSDDDDSIFGDGEPRVPSSKNPFYVNGDTGSSSAGSTIGNKKKRKREHNQRHQIGADAAAQQRAKQARNEGWTNG